MSKTTINDVAQLLKGDNKKGDSSFWGVVQSLIYNDDDEVIGYNVSIDSDGQTGTIKCNKVVGAKEGDQVFVVLRANGEAVVTSTKGGDTDALDAYDKATSIENHFWYDSSGAHVSQYSGTASSGANTLLNSGGLAVRSGTRTLSKFASDASYFYDTSGNISGKFGAGTIICDANPQDSYGAKMTLEDDATSIQGRTISISALRTLVLYGGTSLSVGGSQIDIGAGSSLIHINEETLADFVIAQGTDTTTGWSYRKWSGGQCELWRRYNDTFAMKTEYSGGYSWVSSMTAQKALTLPFKVYNAVCTGIGYSGGNSIVASVPTSEDTSIDRKKFNWRPYRMDSSDSTSRTFHFKIDGYWKE